MPPVAPLIQTMVSDIGFPYFVSRRAPSSGNQQGGSVSRPHSSGQSHPRHTNIPGVAARRQGSGSLDLHTRLDEFDGCIVFAVDDLSELLWAAIERSLSSTLRRLEHLGILESGVLRARERIDNLARHSGRADEPAPQPEIDVRKT